jgi:hypothetical protein
MAPARRPTRPTRRGSRSSQSSRRQGTGSSAKSPTTRRTSAKAASRRKPGQPRRKSAGGSGRGRSAKASAPAKGARKPARTAAPARKPAPKAARSTKSAAPRSAASTASRPLPASTPVGKPGKTALTPAPVAPPRRREVRGRVRPEVDERLAAAARSGHDEQQAELARHTATSPALTAGDIDADWEDAYAVGDEAPGGDNPTPDQDRVDEIGKAVGLTYQDNEELSGEKVEDRDRHRWELDPASSDDWPHDPDKS